MKRSLIFADFNGIGVVEGYISLEFHGSICDLLTQKIKLYPGLPLTVYDDGNGDEVMELDGVAVYLKEHQSWFLKFDSNEVRRLPYSENYKCSLQLNCFHCGKLISSSELPNGIKNNIKLRCHNCNGYIFESILPPDNENA